MNTQKSFSLLLRAATVSLALAGLSLPASTITLTNTSYPDTVNHFQLFTFFNDSLSGWGFPASLTLTPTDNQIVLEVNAAPGQMYTINAGAPGLSNVRLNMFLSYQGDATSLGAISNAVWDFDMVSGSAPVLDPGWFSQADSSQFALSPMSLVLTENISFTGFRFTVDLGGAPGTTLNLAANYLSVTGNTVTGGPVLAVNSTVPDGASTGPLVLACALMLAARARGREILRPAGG